jgi:ankyrin repeat protein
MAGFDTLGVLNMNSNEVIKAINLIATAKKVDAAKIEKLKKDIKDSLPEDKQLQAETWLDEVLSGLKNIKGETNLLPLCQLIYLFEKNGVAGEHADKLTSVFKNLKISLKYLASFKDKNVTTSDNRVMHDACLFQVPDKDSCQFSDWQKLAANFMQEPKFRALFEHAAPIEKQIELIRKSPVNPEARELKSIENELTKSGQDLKKLLRKDSATTTAEEDEVILTLTQRVSHLKIELAKVSYGIPLARLNLTQLDAFYEKYKNESNKTYAILIDAGVTPKKISEFLALTRQDSDERIPDIIIEGDSIGYPGYYLRKLHVLEDEDAALGAVLGRKTNCCQSITGEAGEACAIHGLTSLEGGFYVLFKGEEVVAQAWAWRSKNNAIVFDSIEVSKEVKHDGTSRQKVVDFYQKLSIELVQNKHTRKVACGTGSGISSSLGVHSKLNSLEVYKDYNGYSDSRQQSLIYDLEQPYFFYNTIDFCKEKTKEIIKSALMNVNTPLTDSKSFCRMMNWAILNNRDDILEIVKKTALKENVSEKFLSFEAKLKKYCSNNAISSDELLEDINNNMIHSDLIFNLSGQTLLSYAAEQGMKDICSSIIEKGADINVIDWYGRSPLSYAAEQGWTDICERLIKKGADINAIDLLGCSPLCYAAKNGHTEICAMLVEKGADVNITDRYNRSPLIYAAKMGSTSICESLITGGAKIDNVDNKGRSPLSHAAEKGLIDICLRIIEKGADINAVDSYGRSPLSYAAEQGWTDICERMIVKGANVNLIDKLGRFPLSYAAEKGHMDICKKLILQGAYINPILDDQNYKYDGFEERSVLGYAAQNGHTEICAMLVENGADVNIYESTNSRVPLLYAAENGHTDTCAKLIEIGAVIDGKSSFEIPLIISAKNGKSENCLMLINKGANINKKDYKDCTALVYAIQEGLTDVVDALLKKGADQNIGKDEANIPVHYQNILQSNITPIEVAILAGKEDVLEVILRNDFCSKYLEENSVKIIELINRLKEDKKITEDTAISFKKMIASPLHVEDDLISQTPAPIIQGYKSLHSNQEREAPPEFELDDLINVFSDEKDQLKTIEMICKVVVEGSQAGAVFDLKNIPNEKKELVYQMLKKAIEDKDNAEGRKELSKPHATISDSSNLDPVSKKRKL